MVFTFTRLSAGILCRMPGFDLTRYGYIKFFPDRFLKTDSCLTLRFQASLFTEQSNSFCRAQFSA